MNNMVCDEMMCKVCKKNAGQELVVIHNCLFAQEIYHDVLLCNECHRKWGEIYNKTGFVEACNKYREEWALFSGWLADDNDSVAEITKKNESNKINTETVKKLADTLVLMEDLRSRDPSTLTREDVEPLVKMVDYVMSHRDEL